MDARTREFVRQRAAGRCEYCRLPQEAAPYYSFHIEHIRARQHQGGDEPSNLALACPDCNAKKGPNIATASPDTGRVIELFNPRQQHWEEHFAMVGPVIGTTETGRATIQLLDLNEEERVAIRAQLLDEGAM
jgi:5-methylcytosine-specific restriction endonuclease McrA